jgi:type I restriction enzyme R subunit
MIDLDGDMLLAYYRMDKTHEGSVTLPAGEPQIIIGATEIGTGKPKEDDTSALFELIDLINERFGTDFTEGNRLITERTLDDHRAFHGQRRSASHDARGNDDGLLPTRSAG